MSEIVVLSPKELNQMLVDAAEAGAARAFAKHERDRAVMNYQQVAEYLDCSVASIKTWIKDDDFPARYPSVGTTRFFKTDVDAWLSRRRSAQKNGQNSK